jgi:uncharacterized damage-inducible protein DinB
MNKEFILGLLKYNHWANLQALASIKLLKKQDEKLLSVFCHLLIADRIWYERIKKKEHLFSGLWDSITLEQCEEYINEFNKQWQEYISESGEKELDRICVYRSTEGELFNNTVREIIQHVVNHSSYHRGQIAVMVKKDKGTPAVTDYIVFQRS